ncbi:MAG TPA: EamA family transporter [Candidatus Baltobacteraceae bacterium]|nr:EamA family transporter [Candidatus Baltobacteraceae bacterium]
MSAASSSPRSGIGHYAILAGAQVAVGAAAIFARFALTGAPPLAVSAWRLIIASAVLLVIAALAPRLRSAPLDVARGRSIPHDDTTRRAALLFIAAGIALAVHFATWIASLDYTSVAVSTLLVATTPIWTAIYDSAVYHRRLSPIALGAFLVGAVGLVLVVGYSHTRPPIAGHALLGDALAVAGAIAIGAYFILIRRVRASYGTRTIVTRTYSWAALALLIASLATHQMPPAFTDGKAWGGIIAMALVSQLLGHTAMNAALRWFSASAVAMTTLFEPVTAAVLAFFIFGETLTPLAIAGGLLVLVAIGAFLREEARLAPGS